jgi:hypothetical protein
VLYVPRDPARELDKDLKVAAIPKYTREGKVDFHALRLAYINFVLESGASVKEAQALARHATPAMTMNVYGRTRNERLVQTVERVGEMVSVEEKRAGSVPEPADTTAGDEGYTQVFQEVETRIKRIPKGGFEPPLADDVSAHACDMSTTQCIQNQTLGEVSLSTLVQKDTPFERPQNIFLRDEHGICMGDFPEDLTLVVAAWDKLPAAVRAGIVAMVNATQAN